MMSSFAKQIDFIIKVMKSDMILVKEWLLDYKLLINLKKKHRLFISHVHPVLKTYPLIII